MLPGRLLCVRAQVGDAALGHQGAGHSHPIPQGTEGKGPSLLGAPLGTNTAADEHTEPEELKEKEGGRVGRLGGR